MAGGEKRRFLLRSALLGGLRDEDLDRLVEYVRVAGYAADQEIFSHGDPGHSMMIVVSGKVKITSPSPSGSEVVLNVVDAGEVFGEIALLDGKPRSGDATAMVDSELLVLERREFIPFLEKYPRVSTALLAQLCERLRQTTEMVEDALFLDLPARLSKTLLNLARRFGQETDDGVRIGLKLSQQELGTFVGMTRESINKQLRAWSEQGLVQVDRGLITILDSEALEQEID